MLDEPTASLDATTEHALFERFAGAAREAAERTGAITILVSHRFSTVRMADLIVVLDDGRIVEAGSHDELIARGGTRTPSSSGSRPPATAEHGLASTAQNRPVSQSQNACASSPR